MHESTSPLYMLQCQSYRPCSNSISCSKAWKPQICPPTINIPLSITTKHQLAYKQGACNRSASSPRQHIPSGSYLMCHKSGDINTFEQNLDTYIFLFHVFGQSFQILFILQPKGIIVTLKQQVEVYVIYIYTVYMQVSHSEVGYCRITTICRDNTVQHAITACLLQVTNSGSY